MGELGRTWRMKRTVKMSRTQPLLILPFCSQNASAGVERLLLGNKCDMEAKRKVQKEQADKVKTKLGNVLEKGWEGQDKVRLQKTWLLPFLQLSSSHFTPYSWLGSMESDFSKQVPNPV